MKLNLGCGSRKEEGFINIDNRPVVEPDLVCDVREGLPYEDNSIEYVIAKDFLEHIEPDKVLFVMYEIWRVLKPGCYFESLTPSSCGRGAFQDPTHRSFWNYNSWSYWTVDVYREQIGTPVKYEVAELRDILTSDVHQIIHTHAIMRKVLP